MPKHSIRRRYLMAAGAVALLTFATACTEDHLARRESVTLEAGNAKAVNVAQTAVDTMPTSARRTTLSTDGKRMTVAIERYRNPPLSDTTAAESGSKIDDSAPSQN